MSEAGTNQVKAIIFDCFGVLVGDRWLVFKQKKFKDDPEKLARATELRRQADGNKISRDDFHREVSQLAGITEQAMADEIDSSTNVADQDVLKYVSELKKDYKIGFLSNASKNYLGVFFTPEQQAYFDKVAISYQTGFVKPDPNAYIDIATKLDTPIEQCLLIDDQPAYCEGAKAVGMKVVQYTDLNKLKTDIQAIINRNIY